MPLVSIIIPSFNAEEFVHRAIDSALKQSYKPVEILLIDNNSTDNTKQILKKYENKFPSIIKVLTETKPGAPAARNLGLQHSTGSWIQFLDADDELLPEKIAHQMDIAKEKSPDVIVADFNLLVIKSNQWQHVKCADDAWEGLIRSMLGISASNLWRKDCLVSVGGWNEQQPSSQEYELLFRILKKSFVVTADHRSLTNVYAQPNSISRSADLERKKSIVKTRYQLRLDISQHMKEHNLLQKKYQQQLNDYFYRKLLELSQIDKAYFQTAIKKHNFPSIKIAAILLTLKNLLRKKGR